MFSFPRLVLFQINLTTKSLTVELTRFFNRIDYNIEENSYTKQSYSEARMKMKHEAYIELNEDLVREYYTGDVYKKYKGYRLIAIDGSRIGLPNKEELVREFGLAENKGKSVPMAMSSTAYDVLNNIAINSYLERYETSERELAERHISKIKGLTGDETKDILIMDRGYPSMYLFAKMIVNGFDFVVRCNASGFLNEVKEVEKNNMTDSIIEIDLTAERWKYKQGIQELTGTGGIKSIKLRLVRIILETGTTEYIITSVLDKAITVEDFKEIYHLRWNEEVYFNCLKNIIEVENFSGRTPETIRQDYYARVLSGNISSLIIEEAQEEIDKETSGKPNQKYAKYKINKSVAIGILKDEVIEMLLAPKDISEKMYQVMVKTIKKHKIPIIPGRSFERKLKIGNRFFLKRRKVI
ncbi:MAG: IS4 family transposase [Ignavibacteria bacterium]|nr:IS4 family transposase [Ignavibacteria bacterium]